MNKKGFTLIELLAVIIIISVVALIAVPNVIKLVKGTEQDIFKANEKSLADSAETYFSVNIDLLPDDFVTIVTVNLEELIVGGYSVEIKGLVEDKQLCEGYVEVKQTKNNMYEYTPFLDCGSNFITPGYQYQ